MSIDLQQTVQNLLDSAALRLDPRFDLALCTLRNTQTAWLDLTWACVLAGLSLVCVLTAIFAHKLWGYVDDECRAISIVLAIIFAAIAFGLYLTGTGRMDYPELYIYGDMFTKI